MVAAEWARQEAPEERRDEWVSREWNWREDSNREVKNSTTGDRERRKSKRIHFAPVLQVLQLHCTPRARCVRR